MFYKTSSCIKRLISPSKNKKVPEDDRWPQNRRTQERELTSNSWLSQDRKSMDEEYFQRGNTNSMTQDSSQSSMPNSLSTQQSLRLFDDSLCNPSINAQSLSSFNLNTNPGMPNEPYLSSETNSAVITLSWRKSAKSIYEATTSTSQINLLEALALEPADRGNKIPQGRSLSVPSANPDRIAKSIPQTIRQTNRNSGAPKSTPKSQMTASRELYSWQDSTSLITKKIYPRVESRRQYRPPVPLKVILTKPKNDLHKEHDEEEVRNSSSSKPMLESTSPLEAPSSLVEIRKRVSGISSRERAKHITLDGRSGLGSFHNIKVENIDELSIRLSSETSRSTGSSGSTPPKPFHLEDLPLRVKLDEDLVSEKFRMKSVEVSRSTASTLTLQNFVHASTFDPSSIDKEVRKAQYTSVSKHEVVLKSTNFSFTGPGYRHGDIRVGRCPQSFTKSEMSPTWRPSFDVPRPNSDQAENSTRLCQDQEGAVDGEIDLRGIQMVISGANSHHWMDEYENCLIDGPSSKLEDLEVKIDELVKWCDDIGIDMGKVARSHFLREKDLQDDVRRRRRRRQINREIIAKNTLWVIDTLENGQQVRSDSKGVDEKLISPSLNEAGELERNYDLKDGNAGKPRASENDDASLPPSQMQNISPTYLERPESSVLMGFNVDYDLRSYLKWNNACVNGSVEGDG